MSEPGGNEREAVARRAYEIWESEGRPQGRDREHWEAAAREVSAPAADAAGGQGQDPPRLDTAPKKPARRKKAEGEGEKRPAARKPRKPVA